MHPWRQHLESLKAESRLVEGEESPHSHDTTTRMLLDLHS
jgi:hypothetical protein